MLYSFYSPVQNAPVLEWQLYRLLLKQPVCPSIFHGFVIPKGHIFRLILHGKDEDTVALHEVHFINRVIYFFHVVRNLCFLTEHLLFSNSEDLGNFLLVHSHYGQV